MNKKFTDLEKALAVTLLGTWLLAAFYGAIAAVLLTALTTEPYFNWSVCLQTTDINAITRCTVNKVQEILSTLGLVGLIKLMFP